MSALSTDRVIATHAKSMICPPSLADSTRGESVAAKGRLDFERYRYRHLSHHYRGDSDPREDTLLGKVTQALAAIVSLGRKPLLLLSDGKDSMTLAVGLAELGIHCTTLTLLRRTDAALREYVEHAAKKLGHSPHFVSSDDALCEFEPQAFLEACRRMDNPVLDQGFLFFLLGMKCFFERAGLDPAEHVVLDGLGNDEYFGYLPSKDQFRAYRLSGLGLWKLVPQACYPFRWYVRSPSEAQGDLSALACFFPISGGYDLNEYFSDLPHSADPKSFVDFRAFSRGSFHDHQCMMGKTRAAAKFLGTTAAFPWLDTSLADHCFNLPLDCKFDFGRLLNKLPLRALLAKRVDWSQTKRGVDLYFDLNHEQFSKMVEGIVPSRDIERIKRRPFNQGVKSRAYLELLNLFGFCVARGMTSSHVEELLYT